MLQNLLKTEHVSLYSTRNQILIDLNVLIFNFKLIIIKFMLLMGFSCYLLVK